MNNQLYRKITDAIIDRCQEIPHQEAVVESGYILSYEDLGRRINELSELFTTLGVQQGWRVGVLGQNSGDFITHMLAVMHMDAICFPISHQLKTEEIRTLINRSQLQCIISYREITAFSFDILEVDNFYVYFTDLIPDIDIYTLHDIGFVRYTSGTTGKSKGVALSHRAMLERTEVANQILGLGVGSRVIWVLSMAYHFVVSILLYLRYGATIYITDGFLADQVVELTRSVQGHLLYLSPMHVRMLNNRPQCQMPSLMRVISTSTAISGTDCRRFEDIYGLPVTQAYGIIEIGLPMMNDNLAAVHPDAVGHAIPGIEVAILNENGEEVAPNQIGHLAIRGRGMFDAYIDPYIACSDVLINGFFYTGDLATKSEDGLVTIAGRTKHVINVAGNKAFPEEIEGVIRQFSGVTDCKVSGCPHPILNEAVMAEVIIDPSVVFEEEALISFCRSRLTTYKIPQKIMVVSSIDRTDSGKIKRHI